jgi:hypothetical protein
MSVSSDPTYERFFLNLLGRGETESAWYVGHYLAYCISPG